MALDTETLSSLRIERTNDTTDGGTARRIVYWGVGAVILIGAVVASVMLFGGKTTEVTTVVAEAETAGPSLGNSVLNASGYVVARRMSTVSSKVMGKIAEIYVEEGMAVEKGQVLARLDPINSQTMLTMAERELEASRRNLAEIEVRLADAQRNLGSQRATHQAAARQPDRARYFASGSQRAGRASRSLACAGQGRRERPADAPVDYADLEVKAPFAGVVISKDAQPGEMISPMSSGGFTRTGIATIVDMDSREVEVDVNESYINRVKANQRVEATLDAYPDAPLAAHVINIVPTADRTKATVRVRIGFEKLDPRILPDMGIKVRFLDDAPAPAANAGPRIRVPSGAVQREGGEAFVWVVSDGRAERRAVTLGPESEGSVEIRAGVQNGEELISPVVQGLEDGGKVKLKAS